MNDNLVIVIVNLPFSNRSDGATTSVLLGDKIHLLAKDYDGDDVKENREHAPDLTYTDFGGTCYANPLEIYKAAEEAGLELMMLSKNRAYNMLKVGFEKEKEGNT